MVRKSSQVCLDGLLHLGHIFGLVEVMNVALGNKPNMFMNGFQVPRLRWPIKLVDLFFLEEVTASTGSMTWSVVLHGRELLIRIDLINEGDQ